MDEAKVKFPKILVVCNNSFSSTRNMGKTLESLFLDYPCDLLYQLYFYPELPDTNVCKQYYRITDNDILKRREGICLSLGDGLPSTTISENQVSYSRFVNAFKNFDLVRLMRELIWVFGRWNTKGLVEWIGKIKPDVVFFCAGDSLFGYRITKAIKGKYSPVLVTFITDDYILPRKKISPFWWIRRNLVFNRMRDMVKESKILITISDKMRKKYEEIFNKSSIVAMNISGSKLEVDVGKGSDEKVIFIYAGGVHFKRYKTLRLLAMAIQKYNMSNKRNKAELRIYSNQKIEDKILRKIVVEGASSFEGSLSSEELKVALNKCSFPVHVESFDKHAIECTRLSVSTKIPEYLSLGKPIVAIGPSEVASMEFLKTAALCITEPSLLPGAISSLIENKELQQQLIKNAIACYSGMCGSKKSAEIADAIISEWIKINDGLSWR